MFFYRIALPLATAIALFGCAPDPKEKPPIVTTVREETVQTGDRLPVPPAPIDIVLTIKCNIDTPNQDKEIVLDRDTLESLQGIEYKIIDPFEQKENTFQGVYLNDILDLCQISAEAQIIEIIALNDYKVELPIEFIRQVPMLFALKQNGVYMQENYRGPAMLVVPPHNYDAELPRQSYWIWQITSIIVQ